MHTKSVLVIITNRLDGDTTSDHSESVQLFKLQDNTSPQDALAAVSRMVEQYIHNNWRTQAQGKHP
jgi:hypothetical protein